MSRTWERRPRRRGANHGKGRNKGYSRRACCPTHGREPHTATCRRDPVMCGVKAAFDFEGEGVSQARKLAGETGIAWRAYQCPFCELWHLTTRELDQ